jgi:biotin synthase-related radical SAM superfamily protein
MGVESHLFSFFAEEGSKLAERPQPPWPAYLRVQLARYIIEEKLAGLRDMRFDRNGHIIDFGLASDLLESIISFGKAFITTGCSGPDGQVACNRPFGNCLPDVRQWNYPYSPNQEEIRQIQQNILEIE